jgi:3-methyladenine DNA glycosylase/8-oxoguanine DNA glycosylase
VPLSSTITAQVTVPWVHHPSTFRSLCLGSFDPTVRLWPDRLELVVEGGVLSVSWASHLGSTTYRATLDGPSENPETLLTRLVGSPNARPAAPTDHPVMTRATMRHRNLRLPATGLVFVESVKAVLGQRITGRDAALQWARLVRATSSTIRGTSSVEMMQLPAPSQVLQLSTVAFHEMGIEGRRARTIRQLADLAQRGHLDHVTTSNELAARIRDVVGFGPWSIAVASGNAFGDPDALPVGDFHHKNTVAFALTGRARGTDDEMVELLAPYQGWRWWVTRCLSLEHRAPRFDHRRRNIDIRSM